jgi:hypothetical protein
MMSAAPVAGHAHTANASAGVVMPLSAVAPPSGVTLSEVATQKFTAKLGEFTFKTVDQALNAVINWGDGTHSAGTLIGSYATGQYYVQGTHTYGDTGTFKVNVKIFARPFGSPILPTGAIAQFNSVINAAAPKPTPGGLSLAEYAGVSFSTKLGEITYKTVDQALNAVINWGDGTHSAGVLDGSYATGEYYVEGTHTYAKTGTYRETVSVYASLIGSPIHPTSPVAQFSSIAKVTTLKPSAGGLSLLEVAAANFNTTLGEFTFRTIDQSINAVINWGDGTHSAGVLIGSYATGEYYVQGAHTYASPGTYKVDVNVFAHLIGSPNGPGGQVAQFTSVMNVVGNG